MGKILLVTSKDDVSNNYDQILERLGHKVLKAFDIANALSKLLNEKFDLIIVDPSQTIKLKNLSIQQLLGDSPDRTHPVLICGIFAQSPQIAEFKEESRIHFIFEPVKEKTLIEAVNSIPGLHTRKSKFDVRFVNPFLQATVGILVDQGFNVSQTGAPYVKKGQEPSGDLSVLVGMISQGFQGSISLSFDETSYLKLLDRMFHVQATHITIENRDAIAEFLNTIVERAKPLFAKEGLNIQIAPPSILSGKDHRIDHTSDVPTIVLTFGCLELGQFKAEICARG